MNAAAAERVAGEVGGVAITGDVASEADAERAVEIAGEAGDGLRILVNCAGIGPAARIIGCCSGVSR